MAIHQVFDRHRNRNNPLMVRTVIGTKFESHLCVEEHIFVWKDQIPPAKKKKGEGERERERERKKTPKMIVVSITAYARINIHTNIR